MFKRAFFEGEKGHFFDHFAPQTRDPSARSAMLPMCKPSEHAGELKIETYSWHGKCLVKEEGCQLGMILYCIVFLYIMHIYIYLNIMFIYL